VSAGVRPLPEDVQKAVDHLRMIFEAQLGPGDRAGAEDAVKVLTDLIAYADSVYTAGYGVYTPHPAFLVRAAGQKKYLDWPSDKPVPTALELVLLHRKYANRIKPPEAPHGE
jgi:hypothetical protein